MISTLYLCYLFLPILVENRIGSFFLGFFGASAKLSSGFREAGIHGSYLCLYFSVRKLNKIHHKR